MYSLSVNFQERIVTEKKIVEYKLVASAGKDRLSKTITQMISEGWQPLDGGFCVSYTGSSKEFVQAMVKYE